MLSTICVLLSFIAMAFASTQSKWDLSWVAGVEYTPARAPGNSLWWNKYDEYAADVNRELGFAKNIYGFNHLRMFLHNMVYDVDSGKSLFASMDKFLAVADSHGLKVSFVFFDDCWNHAGASLENACVPVKGRHNGCWMAIPQDVERTSVDRFKGYVSETVTRFASDSRVAFWEIFNEPQNFNTFSMSLRHSAFQWAVDALGGIDAQKVPVLSCWDTNQDTQVSDMHRYDTNFVDWTKQVFPANSSTSTLITEGGSRWYQGYSSDSGSPLTVLHWQQQLKMLTPSTTAPFLFGIVLNWELMVGESNTRWHWDTPDSTPEPAIPWDAHVFPDGTPVSYTEAAVIRNWTTSVNELLAFDSFLPNTYYFTGDKYICIRATDTFAIKITKPSTTDGLLLETTVWMSDVTGGGFLLYGNNGFAPGYFVGFKDPASTLLTVETHDAFNPQNYTVLASFDMATVDSGLVKNGWNMLRIAMKNSTIAVYANPNYPESLVSGGIAPRIRYTFPGPYPPVGDTTLRVMISGTSNTPIPAEQAAECTKFDYYGVLSLPSNLEV